MAPEPLTSRELDDFRDGADRFIAELDEEYYLHLSGHKETLELEPIYERHEELTRLDTARRLEGAPTELWRFACEGYLGALTREHAEKIAEVESTLEADVDGEKIPYRMLRPVMSNEADRNRRARLERARLDLLDEQLNPVYLDAARIDREAVVNLGSPSYYELYKRFGFRLDELARECEAILGETEGLWETEGDRLFRERLGIGLADARPADVSRLFRAPELDAAYPADRMVAVARGDARRSRHRPALAVERPPRPRAAAREGPARVLLPHRRPREGDARHPADRRPRRLACALPRGRPHRALRAHRRGPAGGGETARRHGRDRGLGVALRGPRRRAGVAEPAPRCPERARDRERRGRHEPLLPAPLQREAPVRDRVLPGRRRRRRCGERYAELLTEALKIPANPESYLDDIDGSFYVTGYLRSWALEAQLRDFLRSELGNDWFARRDAGDLLRELWSLGQGPTADELLADATGQRLEMGAVAERIREGLAY